MLVALGLYWPAIFVATHVPLSGSMIGQVGMSDKTMHFLAYLALVSLAWFSVSPFEKVNWKNRKVWIILMAIVWYGAFDEWLQGFVGRSPEMGDFYADIGAAFTAFLILTFLSFWPALLVLVTIFIFSITCLTRPSVTFMNEFANSAFYFVSYCFFTLVWIQSSKRLWVVKKSTFKWFLSSIGVPAIALTVMMLLKLAFGKEIWRMDIETAGAAIIVTTVISYIVSKMCGRKNTD
jgi:hypothetical protein